MCEIQMCDIQMCNNQMCDIEMCDIEMCLIEMCDIQNFRYVTLKFKIYCLAMLIRAILVLHEFYLYIRGFICDIWGRT